MKRISNLLAFAIKAFVQPNTNLEFGFNPAKNLPPAQRLVLISFRSPNDQVQLFAFPTANIEMGWNTNITDYND
jgi:hypothetical protein